MKQQRKISNVGFVIGNGKSRLKYNLNVFKDYGLVYGCNALYRDFSPDVIVSVDNSMVKEILESNYQGEVFYRKTTNKHFLFSKKQNKIISDDFGFGSGATAIRLMCEFNKNINVINLVGFDLYGISNGINNVYEGTQNYAEKGSIETSFLNWVNQLHDIFKQFPEINFYRLGNCYDTFPTKWEGLDNIGFNSRVVTS